MIGSRGDNQGQPAGPISRRDVLRGIAAAGGGLVLGYAVPLRADVAAPAGPPIDPFKAYLKIAPDGKVTIFSSQLEVGQGVYTGIATLVAEELDVDWSKVEVDGVAGSEKYYGNVGYGGDVQITGGSNSLSGSWERYRRAGASARAMLVQAAANRWNVPAAEIRVKEGVVSAGSRRATFGELAGDAAKLPTPAKVDFKNPKDWTLIGRDQLQRVDTVRKSSGRQDYTLDVNVPGMLAAMIVHPPLFGAKLVSVDKAAALATPGVVQVVEVPNGVAVVAKDTWSALKGKENLRLQWDESQAERRSSDEIMAEHRSLADKGKAAVARNDGDSARGLASAAQTVVQTFEFPFLAHATLEPLNAVAWLHDGVLEMWSAHQYPTAARAIAAKMFDLDPERIKFHVLMPGGSFGRRASPDVDYLVDCLSILKATGASAPIKLQWTREDDMTAGHYRPMYFHRLEGGLNAQGQLVAWQHRVVGASILAGTAFEPFITDGVDPTSVEGGTSVPYSIPNFKMDLVTTTGKIPVQWWRCVGYTHTGYSTEVFIDQLAGKAGRDPVEFRRSMLKDKPRHLAVLNAVAQQSGWGKPLAAGHHRGVALVEAYGTYVANVAEIHLKPDGSFKVTKVWCAVDCGLPVNPDGIRSQMEGGIGFGLSAVLKGAITLDRGRVQETNYDGFGVLTIDEMPFVEVHIVPSAEAPSGVGEPAVGAIGPAVANAIFAATGKPMHLLPLNRTKLKNA